MMTRCVKIVFTVAFLFTAATTPTTWSAESKLSPPKLVLVLVVDQLRADTLPRFTSRFGKSGFKSFTEAGAYYPLGEYDNLQCMTGPGHATVLTGALPYAMGVPNNGWFDQKTQKPVYCAADPETAPIGVDAAKARMGTSPKNLLGSTVGDELKNSGHASKVVAIALKDRSAIMMGGHRADVVLWHEPNSFRWVSSKKYFPDGKLPDWVEARNAEFASLKGKTREWGPKGPGTGLSSKEFEPDPKRLWGLKPGFPRTIELATRQSLYSPYGVEITVDLAIDALKKLKLGQGKSTDVLAVSISSHDYVAHGLGPNSREVEELTVAEDQAIARLIQAASAQVKGGMSEITMVLTADHGGGHAPEYHMAVGSPAGRIDEDKLHDRVNEKLNAKFGTPPKGEKWSPYVNDFNFYLNHPALDKKSEVARFEAEVIVKKTLLETEGVAYAIGATDVLNRQGLPPAELGRRILNTYYPERSGDVILIPRANWIMETDTATHITSYAYDRYIPIAFAGKGIRPGRYAQSAKVIDIAPTLSFLLGVTPPSLSEGRVLSEALR